MKAKELAPASFIEKIIASILLFVRGPLFLSLVSLALLLLLIPAARATLLKGEIAVSTQSPPNSFPDSFKGAWHCVTTVVDSAVSGINVGDTMQSEVKFVRQTDGRVVALWRQPGWSDGRQTILALNDHEAALMRVNYCVCDGQWSACSHDHYVQCDSYRMTAKSRVEQLYAGQYLGSYTTSSVLYRLD
jgi:hypothetical protein